MGSVLWTTKRWENKHDIWIPWRVQHLLAKVRNCWRFALRILRTTGNGNISCHESRQSAHTQTHLSTHHTTHNPDHHVKKQRTKCLGEMCLLRKGCPTPSQGKLFALWQWLRSSDHSQLLMKFQMNKQLHVNYNCDIDPPLNGEKICISDLQLVKPSQPNRGPSL